MVPSRCVWAEVRRGAPVVRGDVPRIAGFDHPGADGPFGRFVIVTTAVGSVVGTPGTPAGPLCTLAASFEDRRM
ncbi:MAG: hypothetical protein RLZZ383_1826 [Pseudomonadota bacterium]